MNNYKKARPKFELGFRGWFVTQGNKKEVCGFCGGPGKITGLDKEVWGCPPCDGAGYFPGDKKKPIIRNKEIQSINISKGVPGVSWIIYKCGAPKNPAHWISEEHMYRTEQEAKDSIKD